MPDSTGPTDHFISHVVGTNASPPKSKVEGVLLDSVTEGYRPSLPISGFTYDTLGLYQFFLDIESMLLHPSITIPLDIVKAPISVCEHDIVASDDRVKRFAQGQVQVFWDRCIREIMESEYPHGWAGGEVVYVEDRGMMSLKDILVSAPRDVSPLSMHGKAVGVRVRNVKAGQCNLWLGSDTIPAKGFWHAHKKQYGRFYGRSQILTAWRPWKRLAGRDGTEELGDLGTYRFALGNWLIRYPNENTNTKRNGEKQARDVAREMGENLKTGGSIELPSTMHTTDAGGGFKWTVEHIATNGNIKELSEREDRLAKQISSAIGMPSEILEAAETGSGFSGRMVPLMVFLLARQHEADSLIQTFNDNILLPLVRWNFGPKAWAKASVKPLLQTFNKLFAPQPATVAGGIDGAPAATGEPSGGLRTPGIGASAAGAGGGSTPDQIMAAIVQAQMEATKAGNPHANDEEIQKLLNLLPGREKNNVSDGYVGGISKRHHLKAIGVGTKAGHILYGAKAKAKIQNDGEMVDEGDPKAKQRIKATLGDVDYRDDEFDRLERQIASVEKSVANTDRFEKTMTDAIRDMGDKFTAAVSGQAPPVVNVTLPSQPFTINPSFNVEPASVTVQAAAPVVIPAPEVTVQASVIPAPEVTVNVQKHDQPEVKVNVNVEPTPVTIASPVVNVNVPPTKPRKMKIERDDDGNMTGTTEI